MADILEIFGVEYTNVAGIIATDNNDTDLTYIRPQGTKSITANGTGIDVAEYASVNVNVSSEAPTIQSLSVTPSETAQTFNASGVDGYKPVSVSAISSTYVGSGITRRSNTDLTTNGQTVYVPTGYYEEQVYKSIALGELATPGYSLDNTTGKITITSSVSTAGYISSSYTTTATQQLTTQAGSTITPTESEQTAVAAGKYTLGDVKIGAISSTYVGSEIARKTASDATITWGSGNVSFVAPAGYYASGATLSTTYKTLSNPSITIDSTGLITSSLTISANGPYKAQTVSATEQLTLNDSDDLTVSGATVTAPAGYYAEAASKSVSSMTLPTSAASSATSGYTSKATIGRSTAAQYINIPPGYNSAGAYYVISAVANGSATAPASISGTAASVSTGNGTLTLTKTVSVTPSVTAGYVSSGTAGNSSVSLTASVTIDPTPTASGATVTIPAGYYTDSTTKSVASGTAGTPTATKGTVSNHSVSVTPSVTNTTGYITGGTKTGTAVSVSAAELVSGNKAISANGTNIDVTNYATVSVNVDTVSNQDKSVTPTESEQEITADSGYTGLGTVTVEAISSTYVGSGITARSSSDLTTSGATVTVPAGYYASQATKSVSSGSATGPSSLSGSSATITTGTNTITLTKTGVTTTPTVSAGYVSSATASTATVALTASVTVNPTPTASGATVTIPAGYYSAQTTKSVTTMTLPTSTAASATSGYTKKATISRSTSKQYINIAPGYNSAGGYYEISAVANGSATGPSSLSGSSATVSTGTNTLTLTKTGVTTTPTVTAGYVSSATASTATVTLTASVTTKAAATITPTTTNQTIAAGTYLTGAQTIAGDADLVGSNILSTANIFGVQGTVDFIDVYIRSAAPTSSVGNDGDIYIQE